MHSWTLRVAIKAGKNNFETTKMKQMKNRFTLIEMLAVVAIASILIALITPAVQSLLFGSRVDQYTSSFKLGMERTQSKAVAARKYVAMILPAFHNAAPDAVKPYCKGGYRLAYVKKDGSSFEFSSWIEDWKNPNDGAMLVSIEDTEADAKNPPSVPSATAFSKLDKVSGLPSTDLGNACETDHQALIFSPYGGLTGHDRVLYLTFTEAKADGSTYILDNPDNYLVLKLNPVTGRISYFDPYQ